ncbi:hypothetical protein Vafri_8640 [Volvox africanus]|uniref:Uncharacterized protein n=1 Tax=Volvox africanus TaxID=51714 RepID=A0A8J4F1N6_9CHLO|nr:hypothetical protein Vafri_8640 [Volvox africanus]
MIPPPSPPSALPNIKALTLTGQGVRGGTAIRSGAGSGGLRPGGGGTVIEGQKTEPASTTAGGAASPSTALLTREPLRLTLADGLVHTDYQDLAAERMVEEVAAAAALLVRLLPPPVLRRVAIQPYGWLPTTKLQGPHSAWLSELAPLGEVVEAVELVAFALELGDLAALRAALPNLKVESAQVNRASNAWSNECIPRICPFVYLSLCVYVSVSACAYIYLSLCLRETVCV